MRTKAEIEKELAEVREREAALEKELEGVREWVVTGSRPIQVRRAGNDSYAVSVWVDDLPSTPHARALAELCRDELNALDAGVPGCREVMEASARHMDTLYNSRKNWGGGGEWPVGIQLLRKWADFHLPVSKP